MTQRWGAAEAAARFDTPALHQLDGPILQIDGDDDSIEFDVPATFGAVVCADVAADSPLGRSVDVIGDLDILVLRVNSNPKAATTLAQLLRVTGELDQQAALVAESLAYATLQAGTEFERWLSTRGRRVRPDETGPVVVVDESPDAVAVRLNRPRLHNAFNARMRDELREVLIALDADKRSVSLSGEGASFSIGGDLAEFGTVSDPATAHQLRMAANVAPLLVRIADRLTVDVHGASVGAGVELAAFANHVRAQPDATFRLPEVSMGLIPGAGGTVSIPARIGVARAMWLALSDEVIDATTALSWGLIDEIVDGT